MGVTLFCALRAELECIRVCVCAGICVVFTTGITGARMYAVNAVCAWDMSCVHYNRKFILNVFILTRFHCRLGDFVRMNTIMVMPDKPPIADS